MFDAELVVWQPLAVAEVRTVVAEEAVRRETRGAGRGEALPGGPAVRHGQHDGVCNEGGLTL